MQKEFGDDVTFVGVASRDEEAAISQFVDTYNVGGFEHALDIDGIVWERYGVVSQPAFAFIDGDGGEVDVRVGVMGVDGLTSRIEELIAN